GTAITTASTAGSASTVSRSLVVLTPYLASISAKVAARSSQTHANAPSWWKLRTRFLPQYPAPTTATLEFKPRIPFSPWVRFLNLFFCCEKFRQCLHHDFLLFLGHGRK